MIPGDPVLNGTQQEAECKIVYEKATDSEKRRDMKKTLDKSVRLRYYNSAVAE